MIGNPPYKERARGRGGWVESGTADHVGAAARLDAAGRVGCQRARQAPAQSLRLLLALGHLESLWRQIVTPNTPPVTPQQGIVCFITVAGFLNGPGFQKMRADLRRDTDEIWVIDCSPEGHQPPVSIAHFSGRAAAGMHRPRDAACRCDPDVPACVRFRSLPEGTREDKFEAISAVTLDGDGWADCPSDWRAPFLPAATGEWDTFPALDDFFVYNGSGVMPGRTWVIAPDAESLATAVGAANQEKPIPTRRRLFFHPHLRRGKLGDKHINKAVSDSDSTKTTEPSASIDRVANDYDPVIAPERYGFRSFDRQWIIPDCRLINRPNPTIWKTHSARQVYLTALVTNVRLLLVRL